MTRRSPVLLRCFSAQNVMHSLSQYGSYVVFLLIVLISACSQPELDTVSRCYPADACGAIQYGSQPLVFTATGGDAQNGAGIYASRCAACHGPDGRGTGQIGQGDFSDAAWQTRFTDNQIRLTVRQGRGMAMPPAPMPDKEMRDLIVYIRTLAPATQQNEPYP